MIKLLFILFTQAIAVAPEILGCYPMSVEGKGLTAKFYSYPFRSEQGFENDFFTSGYRTRLLGQVEEVISLNFQKVPKTQRVRKGEIYGFPVTVTNYTIELTGFFLAPISGNYDFTVAADNGVSLRFGSGLRCCKDTNLSLTGDFEISVNGQREGNLVIDRNTATYELEEGRYYPVKIVHFNYKNGGALRIGYTDPKGDHVKDIGENIHQLLLGDHNCDAATSTIYWKHNHTTTITVHPTNGDNPTVFVALPPVTTTTYWTEPYTSTTTIMPSAGSQPTVIVKIPSPLSDPLSEASSTATLSLYHEAMLTLASSAYPLILSSFQNISAYTDHGQTLKSKLFSPKVTNLTYFMTESRTKALSTAEVYDGSEKSIPIMPLTSKFVESTIVSSNLLSRNLSYSPAVTSLSKSRDLITILETTAGDLANTSFSTSVIGSAAVTSLTSISTYMSHFWSLTTGTASILITYEGGTEAMGMILAVLMLPILALLL